HAAHGGQRGPLDDRDRGRRQRCRRRARPRAEDCAGQKAMTLYFLVKYLHVLGAIVILGTGSGIAFFMLMAHRSLDAAFIARTASVVGIADAIFTLSAVILQPVTGGLLMMLSATSVWERWLLTSLVLY